MGLEALDFEAFDDGDRRKVSRLAAAESLPLCLLASFGDGHGVLKEQFERIAEDLRSSY